jgi:DNA-binding IclR family transcriptional regulator
LSGKGFVASSGDPQRFKLGPAIAKLVNSWHSGIELATLARPIMRRVWEQTSETVALFVPQGKDRVCIAEIPSEQPLSFRRGVGYRERLVRGASGRAILAYQPARRYPSQLQAVRTQGYAVSRDELIKGAVAVAVPFFDASGKVAGALGIFGPSARLTAAQVERYGTLLGREARQLSEALGAPSSPVDSR